MKLLTASAIALLVSSSALADECNSAPKPLEGIRGYNSNTLLLAAGSYYELDGCFILSRRRFGSIIQFGIVNNFPNDVAPVGTLLIKSLKTFVGDAPPDRIKLSRGPGWQLQIPPAKTIGELGQSFDKPFAGSVEQWNALYAAPTTPDDLVGSTSFREPWHAYTDVKKTFSSLDDVTFWRVDLSTFPDKYSVTNYLIRFTPSQSYSFVPFTVQLQRNVTEIKLSVSSNLDALVQQYRILVR